MSLSRSQSVVTIVVASASIALLHVWSQRPAPLTQSQQPAAVSASSAFSVLADDSITASAPSAADFEDLLALSPEHARLYNLGQFARLRRALLQRAMVAVENEDRPELARVLGQLGRVLLAQREIDAAGVYLDEALALFDELGDEPGAASVQLQIGRQHLIHRHRARRASDAYDSLLVARWKINQGRFQEAEQTLLQVAADSAALQRYGAAASAWETLFRGYVAVRADGDVRRAGTEAIRLHAAAGSTGSARAMLDKMRAAGVDAGHLQLLDAEIETLHTEFQESVREVGAARDYALLFNQLRARGDVVGAWRFRLKADATLARAGGRIRYRRQPDVLVELYKSNRSMERASDSLERAGAVFSRYGMAAMQRQSEQLRAQIY